VIPRIRRSHQRTSDCSRQFVPKKRFLAAASSMRVIWRAVSSSETFDAAASGTTLGASHPRKAFQCRNPAKRNPTQVAIKPAAASSAIPRSNPLSRQKPRQVFIVDFNPPFRRKSRQQYPYAVQKIEVTKYDGTKVKESPRLLLQSAPRCAFSPADLKDLARKVQRPPHIHLTKYSEALPHFAVASVGSRLAFPPDSCRNRRCFLNSISQILPPADTRPARWLRLRWNALREMRPFGRRNPLGAG
jgi:hypothetical protein